MSKQADPENGPSDVTYEELQHLEYDFDDAELEVIRHQYKLLTPLYARRSALVSKIDHFWALVFEDGPPDFDQFISPTDSKIFAEHLKDVQVSRPEIDTPNGSPRSIHIKFTFSPNDYFEGEVLEKTFWYRRPKGDNASPGLVSEPVNIRWKKGQDPTNGLTDAAYKLWQKRQQSLEEGITNNSDKKLPEETALISMLNGAGEDFTSFFTLFSFVSETSYVTAEESLEASEAFKKRRRERPHEDIAQDATESEAEYSEQETEVCPAGAEIATVLAEDIWPNAIKYFISVQERDDEDLSELEVSDQSDEEGSIDIPSLIHGKRKASNSASSPADAPASKSRKT